jgi:hypothetical protein
LNEYFSSGSDALYSQALALENKQQREETQRDRQGEKEPGKESERE